MREITFSIWQFVWQMTNVGILIVLVALGIKLVWQLFFAKDKKPTESDAAAVPLGEVIRRQRQRCHMTQEFIADQLGVSRQAVSKWESGATAPSTANLMALANLFQIDAADLLRSLAEK